MVKLIIVVLLSFNALLLLITIFNKRSICTEEKEPENQSERKDSEHKLLKVSTSSIEFDKEDNRVKYSRRNVVGVDHIDETELEIQRRKSLSVDDTGTITEEEANMELSEEMDHFNDLNRQSPYVDKDFLSTPTNEDIYNVVNHKTVERDKSMRSLRKVMGTEFLEIFKEIDPNIERLIEEVEMSEAVNLSHTEAVVSVPKGTDVRSLLDFDALKNSLIDKTK